MEIEFISLFRVGVGPALVRFSEIHNMESTPLGCTRIELSWGHMIVEESPCQILKIIRAAKELNEQITSFEQKEE